MKKAPKKLLQPVPLLQALCHKLCWFTTFCSSAIGVLNSRSSGRFQHRNPAELSIQGTPHISMQEDSCAAILDAFHPDRETCISLIRPSHSLALPQCA
jgi:hypothetical protein